MPKEAKNARKYTPESLQKALEEVETLQDQKVSYREIALKYGVPKSTLFHKIKHPDSKSTFGPSPYLTNEEELALEEWILRLSKKGFPLKKEDLQSSVEKFLCEHPRPNPFKDNRPGDGWVRGFLKRHPSITQRTSEGVTLSSACVSESDIRKWFSEIHQYFEENDLLDVLNDPRRVFNGDESGFQLCPKTGKVLAIKGMKNVYNVETSSSKDNMTVMFTFSAAGNCCPPMIIYNYQRIPQKVTEGIPPDWGVGRSENGWMTSEVFFEYIANVFYPYLQKEQIPLPVIYFLDGHKTHLTYEVSKLCTELKIEMIALYPNATRILQPADVAVFRPVKAAWKASTREWLSQNPGEVITKVNFAGVLKAALKKSIKAETLINGFKACGLLPFDPNAVDYTKCIPSNKNANSHTQTPKNDDVIKFSQFLELIGKSKATELQNVEDVDLIDENLKILHDIYYSFGPSKTTPATNDACKQPKKMTPQAESMTSTTEESNPIQKRLESKVIDKDISLPKSSPRTINTSIHDTSPIENNDISARSSPLQLERTYTESRPKTLNTIDRDALPLIQSDVNYSSASRNSPKRQLASVTSTTEDSNTIQKRSESKVIDKDISLPKSSPRTINTSINDTLPIENNDISARSSPLQLERTITESRPKTLKTIDALPLIQSDVNYSSASRNSPKRQLASEYIVTGTGHIKNTSDIQNNNISTEISPLPSRQIKAEVKPKSSITITENILLTEPLHSGSNYSLCPITGILTNVGSTNSATVLETTPIKSLRDSNNIHQGKDSDMLQYVPVSSEISPAFKIRNSDLGLYLTLPKTPERKGKRDIKRMPFAITSAKYRNMFKEKNERKELDLRKKEDRKKIREQTKIKKETCKKEKSKENPTEKRKLSGQNDTNACKMCCKTTKSGNRVVCDMCKSIYHAKCVPDKHKIHVPEEVEIGLFICHLCYREDDEHDDIEMDLRKKEDRKKIREQTKIKKETCKKEKSKEKPTEKRKLPGQNDTNACKMCCKTTKSGSRVVCDMCKSFYHAKCVPDKHKIHVPEEVEIDLFICHLCYREDDEHDDIEMDENDSEEMANDLYEQYLSSKKSSLY